MDPGIYFFADEVAVALRAFTHGYDLFHPRRPRVAPLRPSVPDDTGPTARTERTGAPGRWPASIVVLGDDLGPHGLGSLRTRHDYERLVGRRLWDEARPGGHYLEEVSLKEEPDLRDRIVEKSRAGSERTPGSSAGSSTTSPPRLGGSPGRSPPTRVTSTSRGWTPYLALGAGAGRGPRGRPDGRPGPGPARLVDTRFAEQLEAPAVGRRGAAGRWHARARRAPVGPDPGPVPPDGGPRSRVSRRSADRTRAPRAPGRGPAPSRCAARRTAGVRCPGRTRGSSTGSSPSRRRCCWT